VQKVNSKIGYATVYRTLKLLLDSGLAAERKFEDGQTRYEHADPEEHHDHLICLSCGDILEFEEERIEALQNEVAKKFGFEVVNHNLELYGYCEKCKKGRSSSAGK
jgi:Fur family ferric uptake transcriptional regulator